MEYRNKAWSYVLHINYHFVCLCGGVEGGGDLKKKQKCTLQVYQTWVHSPTHVKKNTLAGMGTLETAWFSENTVSDWNLPDVQDMIFATFKQHSQIYYTIIYLASLFKLWGFINMDVDT